MLIYRKWNSQLAAFTEHPQKFLEPVILKLSQMPLTIHASTEGLKRLGTEGAKRRLAELADSQYDESVRQPATTALAELGDTNYCGVLLHVMNLRQGYSSDIAARGAGLVCGETAIPELVPLLSAAHPGLLAYEIAYALGNTGSRNAVPVLIELLRRSDAAVRRARTRCSVHTDSSSRRRSTTC